MFGEALLVKPDCIDVDLKEVSSQGIYLPEGTTWYNVFTNK
jgi:alpha-glucosidase (family GH31 glycosyl hydrolase)